MNFKIDHKHKMIGLAAALVIGGLAFLIYPVLFGIVAVIAVLAFVLIKVSESGGNQAPKQPTNADFKGTDSDDLDTGMGTG